MEMRRSNQRWLLGTWMFPIVMIWAVLLPIALIGPVLVVGACFGVLFALPGPPDALADPVTERSGVVTMYAEPWGEIPRLLMIGAACGLVAGAVALAGAHAAVPIGLSAAGFASAVIAGVRAHAGHNIVEIRLTASTLALPQRTIALASIREIELRGLPHHLETGHFAYQERILRLHLSDGASVRVPLPMTEGPGDWFARLLEERIAATKQGASPEQLLVRDLFARLPGAGYRGTAGVLDPDERGLEIGNTRLRIEPEPSSTCITLAITDPARQVEPTDFQGVDVELDRQPTQLVVTIRSTTLPKVSDLEAWLAIVVR